MPVLLLAAALLAQAPAAAAAPPRTVAMGERLARTGLLASLIGVAGAAEAKGVVEGHPELTPAQRARAQAVADQALKDATTEVLRAEGVVFAQALTPEQLKAAVIFFESPAGRAYRTAFPKTVMAVQQTGPGKDFKGYVTQRVCAEAQVCPAAKK